jgi:predicted nucleotidyltransferase
MKNTGISDANWEEIKSVIARFPKVEEVILYGSRSMGTFHSGSDIDLALKCKNLDFKEFLNLHIALENLELLQDFDLVDLNKITNPDLIDHINRKGIIVFHRDKVEV